MTCNVYQWSAGHGGLRVAPMPWPDGTATGLEVGTALFTLRGVKPECALGVDVDARPSVYVAVDLNSSELRPLCQ